MCGGLCREGYKPFPNLPAPGYVSWLRYCVGQLTIMIVEELTQKIQQIKKHAFRHQTLNDMSRDRQLRKETKNWLCAVLLLLWSKNAGCGVTECYCCYGSKYLIMSCAVVNVPCCLSNARYGLGQIKIT